MSTRRLLLRLSIRSVEIGLITNCGAALAERRKERQRPGAFSVTRYWRPPGRCRSFRRTQIGAGNIGTAETTGFHRYDRSAWIIRARLCPIGLAPGIPPTAVGGWLKLVITHIFHETWGADFSPRMRAAAYSLGWSALARNPRNGAKQSLSSPRMRAAAHHRSVVFGSPGFHAGCRMLHKLNEFPLRTPGVRDEALHLMLYASVAAAACSAG
jgi:hypothetical protein